MARLTIIGVGNLDRGDDAIGLLVVRSIAGYIPPDIDVLENRGDVTALVTALESTENAVVIDAVRSGAEPGTIHTFDAAGGPLPTGCFRCSTHAFGLAEAIELTRSLGRLPRTLRVYGVEGRDFSTGAALSKGIGEAIENTAERVRDYAGQLGGEAGE